MGFYKLEKLMKKKREDVNLNSFDIIIYNSSASELLSVLLWDIFILPKLILNDLFKHCFLLSIDFLLLIFEVQRMNKILDENRKRKEERNIMIYNVK